MMRYLWLTREQAEEIARHAAKDAPREACGIIGGVGEKAARLVPVINVADNPLNQYRLDDAGLVNTARALEDAGLEIIGFYHSHPDHPAQWSTTDLAEAHWFGCSYVITAVQNGRAVVTNSFLLMGAEDEEKHFYEEKIVLVQNDLVKSTA